MIILVHTSTCIIYAWVRRNAITFKKAETDFCSDLFILPLSKPGCVKDGDTWQKDAIVVAYWYIATTDKKSDANMIESTVHKRGIDVPVLVNLKDIDAYT